MQIISGTTQFQIPEETAAAIGKFDGVHLGHRVLLRELVRHEDEHLTSVVFTFSPSPESFFSGQPEMQLTTREEKRRIFEGLGVDVLIEYPFDQTTADMPPEDFVRRILCERLHASLVVAGEDLSFGQGGKGDFALLDAMAGECGYRTVKIRKVREGGEIISSSRIRKYVTEGQMEEAASCLGSPYQVIGKVMHGNAIGRTIGIPTLNLLPEKDKLLPPYGVYYSHVHINGKTYFGMTNIGRKPTIEEKVKRVTVETYVYDFHENVYGVDCIVDLLTFRRPEKKFENLEALREQMDQDVSDGRLYHGIR